MSSIVGIDLGTTNSLIATMEGDSPRVIPDESGQVALPSVVAFTKDEGILVGTAGKERLVPDPAHTIYSIKRYMGKGREDLGDNLDLVPYALVGEEKEAIRIQIGQKRYTPPEISAHILRALKNRAESALNVSVDQVVITVPAYFNDSQRQATKDAGEIAGLNVLRILNEPTAASLAYGLQKIKKGTIAVYDLGGGTFDISILKINHGIFEVLATNGNTYLGGDDFDRRLVTKIREEILRKFKVDIQKFPGILQKVRLISEKVKCQLSSQSTADFSLVFPEEDIDHQGQITREEFETSIRDLVDLTVSSCRKALSDAELEPENIDEVVLVGGSTRIPLVKNAVQTLFNQTPKCELNPDEVVAMGAAVQANILSGGITDMLLLDVTPLSLGIETMGGVVNRLIPRNTTIPTTAKESYTTYVDGQKSVSIHVVQGERELVKDCRSLAKFNLTGIDPMPAGMPRIEVTFLIDANGILNVTAKDLLSGRATSVEVTPTYGLSEEETAAMITASMEHAKEDLENRQLIESRTEAETVLRHSEKALTQEEGLLDEAERQKVENAISELKAVLSGDDRQLIREKLAGLDQATQTLAEKLMSQSVKEALKNKKLSEF